MELVAQGDWIDRMRKEMESLRDPEMMRRLPFCTIYVLFAGMDEAYERCQDEDRAIIGLPPMSEARRQAAKLAREENAKINAKRAQSPSPLEKKHRLPAKRKQPQ